MNIFLNVKNPQRANYIWNILAGLLNASEAVLLSMIITRLLGLSDAGIITIAFTTANLFSTIGKYGGRNFQVTDNENRYTFKNYLWVRIITVCLMIIISLSYCVMGMLERSYTIYKAGTIFAMCMILAVEAIEDVFWGLYQKNGRLDIGAKLFIIRWGGILAIYAIGICLIKNLLITSVIAFFGSVVLFYLCNRTIYPYFVSKEKQLKLGNLLKDCFPLCVSAFLRFYISNAPKYAIDKYLTDEIQACFGFVSMPVFVINLFSEFIYQPLIVNLVIEWDKKEYFRIIQRIQKQIFIIFSFWLICLAGAYMIGIPVLSLLFHADLSHYKYELLLMLSGGGLLAITSFFVVILTIMRKTKNILVSYITAAVIGYISFPLAVLRSGTVGASVLYAAIMFLLTLLLGMFIIIEIRKRKYQGVVNNE